MQFAFGSKIVKPGSTKAGMSGKAGEARGKTKGGAVADGGSNAPIRSRRSVCFLSGAAVAWFSWAGGLLRHTTSQNPYDI